MITVIKNSTYNFYMFCIFLSRIIQKFLENRTLIKPLIEPKP